MSPGHFVVGEVEIVLNISEALSGRYYSGIEMKYCYFSYTCHSEKAKQISQFCLTNTSMSIVVMSGMKMELSRNPAIIRSH